jgi:hypothetical protein
MTTPITPEQAREALGRLGGDLDALSEVLAFIDQSARRVEELERIVVCETNLRMEHQAEAILAVSNIRHFHHTQDENQAKIDSLTASLQEAREMMRCATAHDYPCWQRAWDEPACECTPCVWWRKTGWWRATGKEGG